MLAPVRCENEILSGRVIVGAIERQGEGDDDLDGISRTASSPIDTSS